jgi:hypothetical protein
VRRLSKATGFRRWSASGSTSFEAGTTIRRPFRGIPAERYRPVLTGIETSDGRLTATIGVRSGPRFRRADCLRVPWTLSVEVANPESMPSTIAIEMLDADGEVTDTRVLGVESDTPES